MVHTSNYIVPAVVITLDNVYSFIALEKNPLLSKKSAANSERLVRSRPMLIAKLSAWVGSDKVKAR